MFLYFVLSSEQGSVEVTGTRCLRNRQAPWCPTGAPLRHRSLAWGSLEALHLRSEIPTTVEAAQQNRKVSVPVGEMAWCHGWLSLQINSILLFVEVGRNCSPVFLQDPTPTRDKLLVSDPQVDSSQEHGWEPGLRGLEIGIGTLQAITFQRRDRRHTTQAADQLANHNGMILHSRPTSQLAEVGTRARPAIEKWRFLGCQGPSPGTRQGAVAKVSAIVTRRTLGHSLRRHCEKTLARCRSAPDVTVSTHRVSMAGELCYFSPCLDRGSRNTARRADSHASKYSRPHATLTSSSLACAVAHRHQAPKASFPLSFSAPFMIAPGGPKHLLDFVSLKPSHSDTSLCQWRPQAAA